MSSPAANRYFNARILLLSYHKAFEKKLPTYERVKETDFSVTDVGIIPTDSEYILEQPCGEDFQHCDGIHFFGVDSGENWIDVCINKIEENLAIAWIFLKLHNGEEYRLPGGPDLRISYIDNESLFSACGLQIRCLSPLRKWRISFNGLLQQCSGEKDNENATDLVHVKFSFVWLSMSLARESNFDFNPKDLARSFAGASNDISFPDLNCFHEFQNKYEQWGHLMGTICLKGKEDNLYLWSCRTRILNNPLWCEDISFSKFYMYFKVGYPIKVETTSVKNFIFNFLVAGGKGCSLALLTELSKAEPSFQVPKGFVITTAAFDNHIKENKAIIFAIQRLIDVSGEKASGDPKDECAKCMEEFQSLKMSDSLKNEIQDVLLSLYDSLENVRFSVRSSAIGEDGEDLSAAGQMLTVLGVRGINNIIDAIIKCWSSKFGFEAVQYARQNGQSIKTSMAVIVQEMVPSEVSGVMFTVDPVTGDPSRPYITANYGLGETVVSSLAEPDTFILQRNSDNSVSINEKIIGTKKTQIYMNAEDGTEQKTLSCENLATCLNDEWTIKVGSVGILVERCFCAPRDIEWALHKNKLYLLQARPITTLHTETDFELIHDQDTPFKSENEFWTRANTGEVFLGATSPLGISLVVGGMDIHGHRGHIMRERLPVDQFCPYFLHVLPVTHRQVTISMIDTLYRSNQKKITTFQRAFEVGLFGRAVGTEEMHQAGVKRYGYMSKSKQLMIFTFLFLFSYRVPKQIKKFSKKIREYRLPVHTFTNVANTWKGLHSQMLFYNDVTVVHGMATYMSSFFNLLVIHALAKGKDEWDSDLYCDFATVLSSCTGVESADVPESLQELAQVIAKYHGTTFSSLTDEMAYNALLNDKGPPGKLFKEFLEKHGHRCIKEFDVYSVSWGMKPKDLIPILQNLVSSPNILNIQSKKELSVEEVLSKLNNPVSGSKKRLLKLILPWSREAVRQREQTKSLVIKTVDWLRQTCNRLGKLMVECGRLPDKELIFFLTLDEIKEVIETRRPGLVSKAMRRSRLHSKLDKLQFPEIILGIPKAIEEDDEDVSKYSSTFSLTGIPVCQGKIKGVARVVTNLNEARTIQNGDILITHSTDIGWTPYFPMLSGVVTVLGGLISHGAVVAREYGLPCVVGVQKAMSAFKSGDIVILDGTKGIIYKVNSEDSETNEL
ncbi:putative phosphoenolpyruvate synthase [Trichonephila inaurata madagascariensis]|uniref:Putative phosphoenolpyruvate synthase n=1 Tax=Trichonephila inaurata madagascariensis TaxID=2747483 RepID=A0A8X6XZ27_9ARAC|nr:putative phosphoenolpyruvate synthase [Trichonephila inaurata madagascariensis]